MRTLVAMLITAALAVSAAAGDLNPPGPPHPTPGPEPRTAINMENTPGDSDSRFRITSPGSYYLTDSITLGIAVNGIEIGADNVTLDLNGFALQRNAIIGFPPLSGIVADSGVVNVTVRNGVVRDFSQIGVDLAGARNIIVDQVIVSGNGGDGMWTGRNGVVTRCVAEGNGGSGIVVQSRCHISGCSIIGNTSNGIPLIGDDSRIEGNLVARNSGSGIGGGSLTGNVITGNSLSSNGGHGFYIGDFSEANVISHNTACDNSSIGFYDYSTASGNSFFGNVAVGNSPSNYSGVGLVVTTPTASTGPWANISQ